MEQKMNDQEVLLVKGKNESKVKAVKGFDENGKLQTELPKQANAGGFLKIDRFSNLLENFFTNFQRQYQNPSEFRFFKMPANIVEKTAVVLDKMLQNPNVSSNKEMLDKHYVKPEQYLQTEEKQERTNLIDENKVD